MTGKDVFQSNVSVSRETLVLFEHYERLITKWNDKINLISPKTLPGLWSRHFLDSAQIYRLASISIDIWADFGSGAGFPGLVCAILAKETSPCVRFTLVESDQRKSAFLMTVVRELGLNVQVLAKRVEAIAPLNADVITARALAPLDQLLDFSVPHLSAKGCCLFPKGANWREELALAEKKWSFTAEMHQSVTDASAVILKLEGITRV